MNVLYHDIVAAPPEVEARAGARRVGFERCSGQSEYVTLHVPLDETTRAMIDRDGPREDAARRDPDQRLPRPRRRRAGRGRGPRRRPPLGLRRRRLRGRAPAAGHPLIGRPDVMLTPHSAAQTVEGLSNMASRIATDVLGVLRGEVPLNPVNDPGGRDREPGKTGAPSAWRHLI